MTTQPAFIRPKSDRLVDCPKLMTNGPCGGVSLDGACEVDGRLCVWAEAVTFAGDSRTTFPSPPPDWSLAEPFSEPLPARLAARTSSDTLDKDQRPCRQGGRFETLLREGRFVVTAEANPPDSANADSYLERVRPLIGLIDAVHISDNSLSSPHMCGLATAALIEQMGMETILHMTCRDRNRIMLQADLLGAAALGVKNVLCLTGDHPSIGDHAAAQPVFDLDAVRWIDTVRHLRDEEMLLLAGPAMARGMNNNTPGVAVPEDVIRRLEGALPGRRREEGLRICVEQIEQLKEMPGVSGIDIMDIAPERYGEVFEAAGLGTRSNAAR